MMEDFGHGIVDSRPRRAAGDGRRSSRCWRRRRGSAACAGRSPRDAPRGAPRAGRALAAILVGRRSRVHGQRRSPGATTSAATGRAASLYALSDRTVAVLRALPRPVEATIFLYRAARLPSGRARSPGLRARADRALHARVGRAASRPRSIDPDRDPQRAEAAAKKYGIGAYEMGQGVVVFTSGHALEGRDLGGSGRAGARRRGRARRPRCAPGGARRRSSRRC